MPGVILAGVLAGCATLPEVEPPVLTAVRTMEPMTPDGRSAEAVWRRCESYSLRMPLDRKSDPTCFQPGTVKLAYNDHYLYLYAELADDDIAQYGQENHTFLYDTGDVIELFLWPEKRNHYWEIYGAPNGRYTVFSYPGPGRRIFAEAARREVKLPLGVTLRGTLNDYRDTDAGWTIELAVPWSELLKYGDTLEDDWRVMITRYNYSKTLPAREFSATTQLPATDFHRRKWYGRLRFL